MSDRLVFPYKGNDVKKQQNPYPDLQQPLTNNLNVQQFQNNAVNQYSSNNFFNYSLNNATNQSSMSNPSQARQPPKNNQRSQFKIKRQYNVQPTVNLDQKTIAGKQLRKYQQFVNKLLEETNANDSTQFIQQVKKQLRQKFFSTISIENQMKNICFKIFYYPTIMLSNAIKQNYGIQQQAVIYKSVALKHADLIMLLQTLDQRNDPNFTDAKKQVEYVMKYLRTWGKYFVDINKLQISASHKTGDSTNRVYHVTQLQMKITIGQFVTVHYKGSQITPTKFRNQIVKQMALQRLRKKATQVLYQIMANNRIPYMFKK